MEPWQLSATRTAELVRGRQLTAAEVAESHIGRIDAVNPRLNAIVLRTDDELRATAAQVDTGDRTGPLAGAVVTTKINTDHVPYPNDNGIRALAGNISP